MEERPAYLERLARPGTHGGRSEVAAAALLYGVDIACFRVSPKGLSEELIRGPMAAAGGGGHALGALGGAAAAERVARGGRGMQVMHLIECGGSFWSAVPEGRMSPPAPSSAASAPSSAASAASSAASAPSSAGASSTGPSPSASSPLASSPLAGKSVLAV